MTREVSPSSIIERAYCGRRSVFLTCQERGLRACPPVQELGVPVTVHAGEWPCGGEFGSWPADNLELALRLGVQRIGHGCALFSPADKPGVSALADQAVMKGVTVECCLTSNVGWKVKSYAEHPIADMVRAGVLVTLNCDNLLLSGAADRPARPSGEVRRFLRDVNQGCGFSAQTLLRVLANGVNGSFVLKFWPVAERTRFIQAYTSECKRVMQEIFPSEVAGRGSEILVI